MWCPFLPDDPAASDSSTASNEGSRMLAVTHDIQVCEANSFITTILGHGHYRRIWPSDHVLNIMCFLSVIVCLILK